MDTEARLKRILSVGTENKSEDDKLLQDINREFPVWLTRLIDLYFLSNKDLSDIRVGAGSFKVVYKIDDYAISVEDTFDPESDTDLYSKLKDIPICRVTYPTDVFYWKSFKFGRMNYCPDGDLRDFYRRIYKGYREFNVTQMAQSIYELGFTLVEIHAAGIYPIDIKPENLLYCDCGGKKNFTFADLEMSPMVEDLINNQLGAFQRRTPFQSGGFMTRNGRKKFAFTQTVSPIDLYAITGKSISRIELIYAGWYALAQTFLEFYSTFTQSRSTNSKKRLLRYKRDVNRVSKTLAYDWRDIEPIDSMTSTLDAMAVKMWQIIDSGTAFIRKKQFEYGTMNVKTTQYKTIIDVRRWSKHYNNVVLKDFSRRNSKTYGNQIEKMYQKMKSEYNNALAKRMVIKEITKKLKF